MQSALNEIRKKDIESFSYSPTERQDLLAGTDLSRPTVCHLFGTLDVTPTYAVSREDLLERIYALESQPRPKNLFDELRQNYLLILGAAFSDWLPWFLRLRVEKRLSESRDWFEYLADSRMAENADLVFLRHFSKQTKRYEGGAVRFVDELWTRWTKNRPALPAPAPLPLPLEPPRGALSDPATLLKRADAAALSKKAPEAKALFSEAVKAAITSKDPDLSNKICWQGSVD